MKEARKVRTLHADEVDKHFEVLNECYQTWGDKKEWKRRYLEFPGFDLTKNVVVVEENGEWAGGVTAWLRDLILSQDCKVKAALAGDAYVVPAFEGKGVYSTAMRSINETSRNEGAALSFAFPAIYGLAATALSKYGYVRVFYPVTQAFVLNHEKFLDDFLSRTRSVVLPKRFDGLTAKVIVSAHAGKIRVSRVLQVEKGNLTEMEANSDNARKMDLVIKSDIQFMIDAASLYFRRKRILYLKAVWALITRRLSFRISRKFLRVFLGF